MRATMAFQPIVDVNTKTIFAYEALARGPRNEEAALVLDSIDDARLADFDRASTRTAIRLASLLMVPAKLNINLGSAASPRTLLSFAAQIAGAHGFLPSKIMFEINPGRSGQHFHDPAYRHHPRDMEELFDTCRREGFAIALDHFGAADAGLGLLSTLRPNAVKLSMQLVRNIAADAMKRASVRGITQICSELGILVIAVGVETGEECRTLRDVGVYLCQGNCFAPPRLEGLPLIPPTVWPRIDRRATPRASALPTSANRIHIQLRTT
jgi:EAL domain-containing protein (putative c-di-GMP-specific phosphodiesterase class I)